MADNEHNVNININGNPSSAVGALGKVVNSLNAVRSAVTRVMSAFGLIGLAIQGVKALYDGFRWLHDKVTETSREMQKMRWILEMRAAANETGRLVGFHERLAKLMKDELDTLAKQRAIQDIEEQGKRDLEDGKREADRARQIYEAKTPEEEQALRDRFAAEDEQRAREDAKKAKTMRIANLADEEGVFTSKANGLAENNRQIRGQIADEQSNLARATTEEDKKAISARIDALKKRQEANEAEIAQFEKEAKFRRDQISALENQQTYEGPTAGEWQRKTEARKRAEENDSADFAEREKKARESDDAAREFVSGYEQEQKAEQEKKAAEVDAFNARVAGVDGPSQNRLTAMGLGSGVSAGGSVQSDVKKLVGLMEKQIAATKENKPGASEGVAVYGE